MKGRSGVSPNSWLDLIYFAQDYDFFLTISFLRSDFKFFIKDQEADIKNFGKGWFNASFLMRL